MPWIAAWMLVVSPALGQEPARPASPPAGDMDSEARRFTELMAIIEGPNPPATRRTVARELLWQHWEQAPRRLTALLSSTNNRPAKLAVAQALSDVPDALDPLYVEPLVQMLGEPDAEIREAASAALAMYHDPAVIERLRGLMLDPQQALTVRMAALETLGSMTQREALAALFEALADRGSPLARPALQAIERASAANFQNDPSAAERWWKNVRDLTPQGWQEMQIERLVRLTRSMSRTQADLEGRLRVTLRDAYARTPDPERPALLAAYLSDPLAPVRLLGLDRLQALVVEGKGVTPEVAARARDLLSAPEAAVRAAAVNTVAGFRESADAERFTQMLARERYADVRVALAGALGYVGGLDAFATLRELLESDELPLSGAAATAIGRLAERGVLDQTATESASGLLQARYHDALRADVGYREQLLRALGRLGDARAAPIFVETLAPEQPAAIRQAAARGLAALVDGRSSTAVRAAGTNSTQPAINRDLLADALVPACGDPDVGVRRPIVEALAELASTDVHLQSLWGRLPSAQESDEATRDAAWRGVTRVLSGRPVDDIEAWLNRVPDGPSRARRRLELLQLMEKALVGKPDARERLGRVRASIARERAATGQVAEALGVYRQALPDLKSAPEERGRVAVELFRTALLNNLYSDDTARILAEADLSVSGDDLWRAVRADLNGWLTPEKGEQLSQALAALLEVAPQTLSSEARAEIEALRAQAHRLRELPDPGSASR
jgi:HEAT repeat protein